MSVTRAELAPQWRLYGIYNGSSIMDGLTFQTVCRYTKVNVRMENVALLRYQNEMILTFLQNSCGIFVLIYVRLRQKLR